jgi:hypothetical protein
MLHKGLITQKDFDALLPQVELKGLAKAFLLPADAIPPVLEKFNYAAEMQEP